MFVIVTAIFYPTVNVNTIILIDMLFWWELLKELLQYNHSSDITAFCGDFPNDLATAMDSTDEWDFIGFESKISFEGVSYICNRAQDLISSECISS